MPSSISLLSAHLVVALVCLCTSAVAQTCGTGSCHITSGGVQIGTFQQVCYNSTISYSHTGSPMSSPSWTLIPSNAGSFTNGVQSGPNVTVTWSSNGKLRMDYPDMQGDQCEEITYNIYQFGAGSAGTVGSNQTICYNTDVAAFTVVSNPTGGDGNYSYQWESRPISGSWTNISGATAATYNHGNLNTSTEFRRKVVSCSQAAYTNTITVTVNSVLSGGSIGSNQTLCYNSDVAAFTSSANAGGGSGSYAYQWQWRTTGSAWTNISGATSSTYDHGLLTSSKDFQRVVTSCGETAYSNIVTVTVYLNLAGGSIGSDQTICYNADVSAFTNAGSPSGGTGSYSYQWQSRPPAGSWSNVSGATSSTYDHSQLTSTTEFRRQVSSCGETAYSNTVTVTVYSTLTGGTIGSNQTICYNNDVAAFTNSVSPAGANGTYSYQWQSRPPGGSWANIGGATTITYDHGSLSATTQFQRQASSCGQVAFSNTITVTVYNALTPGSVGTNQTICYNADVAAFTNTAGPGGGNTAYTYQWQWRPPAGSWTNITGATNATYDHGVLTATKEFRRQVTSCAETQYSNTITVTVNPLSAGGTLSPSVEAFGSANGTLTLTGYTGTIQKWQSRPPAGTWTDIASTSSSRAFSNVSSNINYRVSVQSGLCPATTSNEATIVIYPVPAIQIVGDDAIAPGGSTQLVATSGFYSYAWYENNTVISGQTTNTLLVHKPGNYKVSVKGSSTSPSYPTVDVPIVATIVDQAQDMNYVLANIFLKEGVTPQTDIFDLTPADFSQEVQYFDGLGRPVQTVSLGSSPGGHDMMNAIAYDAYGRENIKYLPHARTVRDGRYVPSALTEQSAFYQNAVNVAHDSEPYAKTIFEPSPVNRVLKQGSPGQVWQPDANSYATTTDHAIKFAYEVNETADVLRWNYLVPSTGYDFGRVNADNSGTPNKYAANALVRNKTKDENQKEVITFTDNLGRTLLKRVQGPDVTWADTYYIYNDFGDLVTVIPPEAVNQINTTASVYNTAADATRETFLNLWAFRYRYDARHRMIMKKVPGAGIVYMVYDNRDRLVMTQDANQRNITPTKEWTFTKYDFLNRPVLTGKYLSNNDQAAMQTAVDNYYSVISAGEAWFETYSGSTATVLGYSNSAYPSVSASADYYTVNYYDTYDTYIAPAGYTYLNESLPGQETSSFQRVNGQVTGTLVKNLSSGTFLRTVNYYDDRYRVIQTIGDHHAGTVRASNVYDFAGKVLISKRTYVVNAVTKTVKETYTYDHAGRVLTVKHSVDGATDVMIVKNEYNELGQLIDKKLDSEDNGTTFKQSVDHRYNIRGWLTKINEADISSQASGDPGYDYFGMELSYDNTVSGLTTTQMFNGNISAMQWSKGNGGAVGRQAYSFQYDPMNRLTTASHFDHDVSWQSYNRTYQEKINSYDLNGNILNLSRRGFGGALMDTLRYFYSGNRLSYVHDNGNATEGFVNANTGTDDYDYDFNGNLDKDKNKGISTKGNIKYNYLNLPREIIKGTESIKYIYDASGRKLRQEVYSNNGGTLVKYTDYIGELVYEGGNLQFIQHAEGRALPDGANWEYQYHLKDHLGNVRVTFTAKPQTPVNYTANLENGNGSSGEGVFGNYTSTTFDLVDHTDAGTTYQRVQWLNGGASGRVGLTKSLSVMPGDRVSITAYAKYRNLTGTGNTNPFAAALTAAFGVSSGSTGEQLKLYNSLNAYGVSVAGGNHPADDDTAPKAFVTILLFDRNYNLLDAAWDQVTTTLEQVSATNKESFDHALSKEVTVQEPGYAYIFTSNEHPTYVDVYFDDVSVGHTLSPIVSSSDYYPFGLTFNSYQRENSVDQRWKFQGQEHIDDLGLNWDSFKWRNHQPDIGRFFNVDPLADKYVHNSPYAFSENKVTTHIELEGLEGVCIHSEGEIQASLNGQMGEGLVESVTDAATSLWNAVTNPVETAKGLWHAVTNPVETAIAIKDQTVNSFNENPQKALGKTLGNMIMATATAGVANEVKVTTEVAEVPKVLSKVDEAVKIAEGGIPRIQNAANRINKPITVVGSRASGTAKTTSDFDYIIPGLKNSDWKKIKNSLPGSANRAEGLPNRIDVFPGPVDPKKPHITVPPTNSN